MSEKMEQMKTMISAGASAIGGPLCLYDENGDAIAMLSDRRPDKEWVALAIVDAVNQTGGLEIMPLPQSAPPSPSR